MCPICQCPRCTQREVNLENLNDSFRYWICSECGHGFKNAKDYPHLLDLQLDTASNHSLRPTRHHLRWPHRQFLVARTIERLAGRDGNVLDIGCSNGAALAALSPAWRKFGVELCPQTAEVARAFAGADVFCGPIEAYRPPAEGFDVITAFALIEHLKNPAAFIQSVRSWLGPDGLLVLMTGDRESRVARRMEDAWPLLLSPDHVHFFSARSLRRLLEQSGFTVVREEWRYMYDAVPRGRLFRGIQKIREILGCNGAPRHDHYYCYGKAS